MNSKKLSSLALIMLLTGLFLTSCDQQSKQLKNKQPNKMEHVEWSKNANIYEVNIRQYTPEGTINAFREHLPRLKEMEVDILWLMPIQPIGELNRKGSLGSYYSVKDYETVNPEFGTLEEFKALVNEAHELGMYVILDWVANHSSWDNVWASSHPEYYQKDSAGNFVSPFDWSDVIAFDYNQPAMRDSMVNALKFWVEETNIDGYRCDVAGMVPTDFWNDAVAQLKQVKPIFMLAEDEDNVELLQQAFDMNYTWEMHHLMNDIAKGEKKASELWDKLAWNNNKFSPEDYRMYFTSNHDENSWNGTTKERMGDASQAFAVLTYTIPGMPLIYSGQEAGNDKRLRFFEKDTIDWAQIPLADFYRTLNLLKKNNRALWNGTFGGEIVEITKGQNENVFAFERQKDGNRVMVIINFSTENQLFTIDREMFAGEFTNVFSGEKVNIANGQEFNLKPWEYSVLVTSVAK